MRAAFLGHGSPMNALEHNRWTETWQAFGSDGPEPRAILAISAHWYLPTGPAATAMPQPPTIHDFFGFPDELFAVQYPAPGAPELAEAVRDLLAPDVDVALDDASWGIDHGTWSLLVHAFPEATVPVVQLSLDARQDFAWHVEVGRRLAPLRDRGVLILASGNVVHNLRLIDWGREEGGFDWAERFDDAVHAALADDADAVVRLREHPDFGRAVPTDEHFLPVLYLAGLAEAAGRSPHRLVDGLTMGSISMASYAL
jgi:4,5-DOPA dioxygenase extradiol